MEGFGVFQVSAKSLRVGGVLGHSFKGFRLVTLGLWVLGSFYETLGDYIGSYEGYIWAISGKPSRGRTLAVQPWNP